MAREIERTVDSFIALAFSGVAHFSPILMKDLPAATDAVIKTALRGWNLEPSDVDDEDFRRATPDAGNGVLYFANLRSTFVNEEAYVARLVLDAAGLVRKKISGPASR
jgi:hypothetical protein